MDCEASIRQTKNKNKRKTAPAEEYASHHINISFFTLANGNDGFSHIHLLFLFLFLFPSYLPLSLSLFSFFLSFCQGPHILPTPAASTSILSRPVVQQLPIGKLIVILKSFLSHPFTTTTHQVPHEIKYPILQHFLLPPDTHPQQLIPPSFQSQISAHHPSQKTTFTRKSKTTQKLTSLVQHIPIDPYIHTYINYTYTFHRLIPTFLLTCDNLQDTHRDHKTLGRKRATL